MKKCLIWFKGTSNKYKNNLTNTFLKDAKYNTVNKIKTINCITQLRILL